MDFIAVLFIILAFLGIVSEHLALIMCAIYFALYLVLCFAKRI